MQFRNAIEEVFGLRFLYDQLELASALGRHRLLSTQFLKDEGKIAAELDSIGIVAAMLSGKESKSIIEQICTQLSQIRDIYHTIKNLEDGTNLSDVEFFEIKHFALTADRLRVALENDGKIPLRVENLEEIIAMLDPEGSRIPSFYVYDSYHSGLSEVRRSIKQTSDERLLAKLYDTLNNLEDMARGELSLKIKRFSGSLFGALEQVAWLDILIAKAKLAHCLNFCRPALSAHQTEYHGLFNPLVKATLAKSGRDFQPIDIKIDEGVTLLNGANMAGKTVLLKSIALSQHLCQFGFYVPARAATIALVDEVSSIIGDDQSEEKGLSAFAAEILKVSRVVSMAKTGVKQLVLIDELARTTNPTEGKAIVTATANLLNNIGVRGIITTHYSAVRSSCRKLRVKGFVKEVSTEVTINNIGDYIDYSLVEDDDNHAPQEALRIASLLGVDSELIAVANQEVESSQQTNL